MDQQKHCLFLLCLLICSYYTYSSIYISLRTSYLCKSINFVPAYGLTYNTYRFHFLPLLFESINAHTAKTYVLLVNLTISTYIVCGQSWSICVNRGHLRSFAVIYGQLWSTVVNSGTTALLLQTIIYKLSNTYSIDVMVTCI